MHESRESKVYNYPTLVEAMIAAKEGLKKHKILFIVGSCFVDYNGRASSHLDLGERIVIIKEDSAVLVHRPTGYEPINWMHAGSLIRINIIKERGERETKATYSKAQVSNRIFQNNHYRDILEIRAIRRTPSESIKIIFDQIYLLSILNLSDEGKFYLYADEKDMQKAILLEPRIIEEGFKPITYEKRVEPGFVDVYGVDKEGRLVVIEIKRKTAGRKAVLQLARYVEAIKAKSNREVRGVLVAMRLAKGAQKLLSTLNLDFKSLNPKKCSEILIRSEIRKISEFL